MALEIGELVGKLRMDSSGFDSSMQSAKGQMDSAGSRSSHFGRTAVKAIGVAGGAAAGAVSKWADMGGAIEDGAAQAGLSTKSYQELSYAFQQMGMSQRDTDRGLQRLNQRMGKAASGNKKYGDAFRALGVSVKDSNGKMKSTDQVMSEVANALSKVKNPAKRAQMAGELLGQNLGRRLAPQLGQGAGALGKLRRQAHSAGAVLSGDSVRAAGEFGAKVDSMKATVNTAIASIGGKVAQLPGPFGTAAVAVVAFGQQAAGVAGQLGPLLVSFQLMRTRAALAGGGQGVGLLRRGMSLVSTGAGKFGGALGKLPKVFNIVKVGFKALGKVFLSNPWGIVIAGVVALVTVVVTHWNTIKNAIATAWNWIKSVTMTVWNAVVGFLRGVWNGIVSWVTGAAQSVWSAVSGAFSSMYNTIVSWLGKAVNWIRGLPGMILRALGNFGSLLLNAGKNLVTGLWNGISGAASWLWNKITGWLKGIWNGIKSFFGIGSPSRLMRDEIGKQIPAGMAIGIDGNAKVVRRSAAQLGKMATAGANSAMSDLQGVDVSASRASTAGDVGDAVHRALHGAKLTVDGRGVAKLVNDHNRANARRGVNA